MANREAAVEVSETADLESDDLDLNLPVESSGKNAANQRLGNDALTQPRPWFALGTVAVVEALLPAQPAKHNRS